MKFKLQPYSIHELGQRANQEDSIFPDYQQSKPEDRLFILCDGMGGHEKGEVASATVCEAMCKTILSRWNPTEPLSDELLQQAIDDAYDALDAKDDGSEKKMGTTMTLVCFHAEGVTVAHIGDSRVYQLRPATKYEPTRIVFKTRDHSLVNDLIDIGEITEEEAKTHPQKNVITRAMQPCQERRAKATIAHLTDVQSGDYFYMCSDGMLEQTSDDNLLNIITKSKTSNEQKVEMLRSVTEENKDNHTAHLIYINKVEGKPVMPQVQKPSSPQGAWVTPEFGQASKKKLFLPIVIVLLLITAVAAGAYFILFGGKADKSEIDKDSDSINAILRHPQNNDNSVQTNDMDDESEVDEENQNGNNNEPSLGTQSSQGDIHGAQQALPEDKTQGENNGNGSQPSKPVTKPSTPSGAKHFLQPGKSGKAVVKETPTKAANSKLNNAQVTKK